MGKSFILLMAPLAFGQVAPGTIYSGRPVSQPTGPVGHGFGSVVFPGTGVPRPEGHIPALGATVRGVPPQGQHHGRGGYVPVAVPVFVGGYGYGYPPQPQQAAPNITVINQPQPSPTVIINQHYTPEHARPVTREYGSGELAEPEKPTMQSYQAPIPSNPDPPRKEVRSEKPTIYLIALKDGTVYSSLAYWVEDATLHYVTTKHSLNKTSIELVDKALSRQLNSERSVAFDLE